MKKIKCDNPFVLVGKAYLSVKREMRLSLEILFSVTAILTIVFYLFEHDAQPDVFPHFRDCLAWSITRYIDKADAIIDKAPITWIGKVVATLLGCVTIAIVAIPAGLVGSGFMAAIAESKREEEIRSFKERVKKSFVRRQCRHTMYRTVPAYVSVVDIQAKQGIDTKDILDAVAADKALRLRNLASTQPLGDRAHDRLVVEHFPLNTDYGCKIDRQSSVTIVSTSSVQESGIGNFAYYLALYGGFNFVSKEIEANPNEPFSYYNIEDEDTDPNLKTFLGDIKSLEKTEKNWVIFLLSASGAEEPSYDTQVHWIHGAKRGDSGYTDPNITVRDTDTYDAMVKECSVHLLENYGLNSDQQKYHAGSSPMYIGRHVMSDDPAKEVNAYTLRIAFGVTVWDDQRIAIAKDIARIMHQRLLGQEWVEDPAWKNKGYGYNKETEV